MAGQLARVARRSGVRSLVLMVLMAGAIVTTRVAVDWETQAVRVRAIVQEQGAAAPPVFIALTALGILLFVPAQVSIAIGSLAFGQLGGALYSLGGITAGAGLAFLLGRYVLRGFGRRLQASRVSIIRSLASQRGPLPAIGLRLAFPFAPGLDYALGATGVSLRHHLLGTSVSLSPRTFALSFFFDILTRSDWMMAAVSVPVLLLLLLMPALRVGGILLLTNLVARRAGARSPALVIE